MLNFIIKATAIFNLFIEILTSKISAWFLIINQFIENVYIFDLHRV